MSTHTIKTQQVVAIPHEQRTQVTLDTLDELEHDIEHIKYVQKKQNDVLNVLTKKLARLRLVLEAK